MSCLSCTNGRSTWRTSPLLLQLCLATVPHLHWLHGPRLDEQALKRQEWIVRLIEGDKAKQLDSVHHVKVQLFGNINVEHDFEPASIVGQRLVCIIAMYRRWVITLKLNDNSTKWISV